MRNFNFYICIISLFLACCVGTQARAMHHADYSLYALMQTNEMEPYEPIKGFDMPKILSGKVYDGMDGCYTEWMQWYDDSLNCIGKVSYIPNMQGRSVLVFSFKDNGCKLTEELKRIILRMQANAGKLYGKDDFSLEINSSRSIWTNNYLIGDLAYSLVGYGWDNIEEADVISISFPLHACKQTGSNRTGASAIKKRLRKDIFTDIVIRFGSNKITIPVDYRFNQIFEEMYKRFK